MLVAGHRRPRGRCQRSPRFPALRSTLAAEGVPGRPGHRGHGPAGRGRCCSPTCGAGAPRRRAGPFALVVVVTRLEMLGAPRRAAMAGGERPRRSERSSSSPRGPLATLGAGLVGVGRRLRSTGAAARTRRSYESARRLLSQLRTVARRLSSGLDTVAMATPSWRPSTSSSDDTRSAVFVRTEGGVLAPARLPRRRRQERCSPRAAVDTCWAEMEPVPTSRRAAWPAPPHRVVLPLRVGVPDDRHRRRRAAPPPRRPLAQLMRESTSRPSGSTPAWSSTRSGRWPPWRSGSGSPGRSTTGSPRRSPRSATWSTTSPPRRRTTPSGSAASPARRDQPRGQRAAAVDLRPAQRDLPAPASARRCRTTSARSARARGSPST